MKFLLEANDLGVVDERYYLGPFVFGVQTLLELAGLGANKLVPGPFLGPVVGLIRVLAVLARAGDGLFFFLPRSAFILVAKKRVRY